MLKTVRCREGSGAMEGKKGEVGYAGRKTCVWYLPSRRRKYEETV